MEIDDKSIKALEDGLQSQLKEMAADMSVNFSEIESNINLNFEKVESNFRVLAVRNDAESEAIGIELEKILKKQDITNGRLTIQEETTEVLRIMVENKGYTFIFLYGLFNIVQHLSISNIIRWINLII